MGAGFFCSKDSFGELDVYHVFPEKPRKTTQSSKMSCFRKKTPNITKPGIERTIFGGKKGEGRVKYEKGKEEKNRKTYKDKSVSSQVWNIILDKGSTFCLRDSLSNAEKPFFKKTNIF